VYQVESSSDLLKSRSKFVLANVSRTVLLLGLTSLLTDVSAEMVSSTFALYVLFTLHLAPVQFGLLDGLYQGASALVKLASGLLADRWGRQRDVAAAGYGLSALSKLGLIVLGGAWNPLIALTLIDRIGKGIRTAPRDALIAANSKDEHMATSFGVHRAMDTVGAMIGPLLAFGLLALTPHRFDSIFVVSLCFAVLGLAVLMLFVDGRGADGQGADGQGADGQVVSAPKPQVNLQAAIGQVWRPEYRNLLLASSALGVFTLSDNFLFLQIQRRLEFNPSLLPLLAVGSALAYMLLAVPVGRLADRAGRLNVFFAGYGLLLLTYCSLLLPRFGWLEVPLYLVLFGAFYAATDGVLMAVASLKLDPALRTSGLAALTTATGLARFVASVVFGALWSWLGPTVAVMAFAVALAVTLALGLVVLPRLARPKP
jgi:MFS family permease